MTKTNLTKTLKELDDIVAWFDAQENVDIEEGLVKVKSGVELVKSAKKRLAEVENTFKEITKDISKE